MPSPSSPATHRPGAPSRAPYGRPAHSTSSAARATDRPRDPARGRGRALASLAASLLAAPVRYGSRGVRRAAAAWAAVSAGTGAAALVAPSPNIVLAARLSAAAGGVLWAVAAWRLLGDLARAFPSRDDE